MARSKKQIDSLSARPGSSNNEVGNSNASISNMTVYMHDRVSGNYSIRTIHVPCIYKLLLHVLQLFIYVFIYSNSPYSEHKGKMHITMAREVS